MSGGNQYQENLETLELLNSQKSILLYNDEVNTFDHVIDSLCKGWLVELENSGLKRIYTEDGDVHYVSSFYYEQVDRIDGYRKAK